MEAPWEQAILCISVNQNDFLTLTRLPSNTWLEIGRAQRGPDGHIHSTDWLLYSFWTQNPN